MLRRRQRSAASAGCKWCLGTELRPPFRATVQSILTGAHASNSGPLGPLDARMHPAGACCRVCVCSAPSSGTIRAAMEIKSTDADLLVIVLADWIQRVMDTQLRIEALEHLLKSQTPDLY